MLTFVTGNKSKLKEASTLLGMKLAQNNLQLDEIQSLSVKEVSIAKAKAAHLKIDGPLIVEDTGLYINALNGFPGAFVKWFELIGYDKICSMLATGDNSAYAETCVAFISGNVLEIFVGRVDGKISNAPRGKKGFGWDSIFEPKGYEKTMAELSDSEKNKVSMRGQAFLKLKDYLSSNGYY